MLSHFRILSLLLLMPLFATSQKVVYSKQEIDAYSYDFIKIAGYNENEFFLFQSNLPFENDRDRIGFKSRKYQITCYNNNLTVKWSKKFIPSNDKERIETMAVINGKVVLIKSTFTDKEDKLNVYASPLDDSGKESASPLLLGSIAFDKTSSLDKIKIIASQRNNLFGIIQNEKKQNGMQKLHCIVISSELVTMRQLQFDVPYPEKNFSYENWLLTEAGDFVLEGSFYSKENNEKRKRWDAYKLFVSLNGNEGAVEYAVNKSDIELNGSNIAYDIANKQLVLAGFYTDKTNGKSGIIYATLKTSANDSLKIFRQPIGESTQARMFSGLTIDKSNTGVDNLNIEKIILRNDGGAVLITEMSYVTDYSYYDYFTQNYIRSYEYHFNNAVALSVNADGSIDWDAVLRKDQVSTNDYGKYSSFTIAQTDNEINLVYNTRIDRNNSVAVFRVKNNGTSDTKEFIQPEDRIMIIPFAARQISADELVIPCWNRKKLLMAKIIFNE